jgi:hypothetical protein
VQIRSARSIDIFMKNPFPGMNPWLEQFWRDVHASLLVYARDQLNAELPPGLQARVDERLAIDAEEEKARDYLPDIVDNAEVMLRHVEIVESRAHVITAIELLWPTNKEKVECRANWKRKRLDYLRGGINVVEIDLLRGGAWVLPDRSLLKPCPPGRIFHYASVTRPPRISRIEFYVLPLRQRLPAIRVPLRRTDPDAALDLQVLIDQCYERGRYSEVIDYKTPTDPPLPEEEAAWAAEILRNKP